MCYQRVKIIYYAKMWHLCRKNLARLNYFSFLKMEFFCMGPVSDNMLKSVNMEFYTQSVPIGSFFYIWIRVAIRGKIGFNIRYNITHIRIKIG